MTAYKDEKRKTWYCAFRYTDFTGKRVHTCKRGFRTKAEAQAYERDFLGRQSHKSDIRFDLLVNNYLDDMESRLKPTTMNTKRLLINAHIVPYFGKRKIGDIDVADIRTWQKTMIGLTNADGEPFSQTYLKTLQNQLSAIFNYACMAYNLPSNPVRLAGPLGRARAKRMNFYTKEQYGVFISFEKSPVMKLAIDILYWTGMRSGELLALTPSDIDPQHIDINKNYARLKGQEYFLTPKTERSSRIIAIPDFLYAEYKNYMDSVYPIGENERIFDFSKQALEKEVHVLSRASGLPEIRVHDLRHSHVALLVSMGIQIPEISRRLGHESISTTWDIYGHLYPDAQRKIASKLENVNKPDEKQSLSDVEMGSTEKSQGMISK